MSDPRAERSRKALLEATLTLLDENAFEAISTAEIAQRAGVSRATLFRNFATKEALLDAVAKDQIETLVAYTLPIHDTADRRTAFLALCEYVDEHRAVWTTLLLGGAASTMRRELLRVSRQAAVGRAAHGDWLPIDLAVLSTTSVIIEGLTWWLTQPVQDVPVKQAAKILYRLVLEPMPPRARRTA